MPQQDEYVSLRYPELRWKQNKDEKGGFNLLRTDLLAGQLTFRVGRRDPSVGRCDEGEWTFHWHGFFERELLIRRPGDESVIGRSMETELNGGRVTFADGPQFLYCYEGTLLNRIGIIDDQAERIVTYRPTDMSLKNIFSVEATVEVTPKGLSTQELPALLFITWVLVLRRGMRV